VLLKMALLNIWTLQKNTKWLFMNILELQDDEII